MWVSHMSHLNLDSGVKFSRVYKKTGLKAKSEV